MKEIILKAENISKQYRLGQVETGTLSHDMNRWWLDVGCDLGVFLTHDK